MCACLLPGRPHTCPGADRDCKPATQQASPRNTSPEAGATFSGVSVPRPVLLLSILPASHTKERCPPRRLRISVTDRWGTSLVASRVFLLSPSSLPPGNPRGSEEVNPFPPSGSDTHDLCNRHLPLPACSDRFRGGHRRMLEDSEVNLTTSFSENGRSEALSLPSWM